MQFNTVIQGVRCKVVVHEHLAGEYLQDPKTLYGRSAPIKMPAFNYSILDMNNKPMHWLRAHITPEDEESLYEDFLYHQYNETKDAYATVRHVSL